jgi:lysyl-tRNA synthetase class 2
MKKLLSRGAPSIFQLSHVFRSKESGSAHAQEFSMAEFYKLNIPFDQFILETCDFIQLFTGTKPLTWISYKEAFLTYLSIDPYQDLKSLRALVEQKLHLHTDDLTDDDVLNVAMSSFIEPCFDKDVLTIVTEFPASQAALAQSFVNKQQDPVAFRFEIYHQHLELANGYKELKCPLELSRRFEKLNQDRLHLNKEAYPIDQELLNSMTTYFPDCCGVACGFDRLLMLEFKTNSIQDVLLIPSV